MHYHLKPLGSDDIVFASGGVDKRIKMWVPFLNVETKRILLKELRTVFTNEEILSIRFTPSGKHYAVSLLDSAILIYYADTDKIFLKLYGHKLPANCIDISSDSSILLSGSSDKNVKLWGMDFGNCHKSIFAH